MAAVLWRYALVSYVVHSTYAQGHATLTFSRSPVLSGDPVALTCIYGSGLVLAFVTVDAFNGTQKVGSLLCSAASGITTGYGVLGKRNLTGCPTFTSGATNISVILKATPSLQLHYNCSARVIDSNGNALTVTSATAYLAVFPSKSAECGSLISGFGLLQSINYPESYINNHGCLWTLQASPPEGLLSLQFLAFDTEFNMDFVRIYSQNGTLIFSYSGSSLPHNVNIGSLATVVFSTNAFIVNRGFSVEVSTIAEPQACSNFLTGFGLLQSDNYPNTYSDEHRCSWTLQASPISGLLHMQFLTFATELDYDFLRIYSETGALQFSYSGTSLPPSLTLGSKATATFNTDKYKNDRGFSIAVTTLDAPSQPCGSLVNGFGLLESVNYPRSYVNNYSCPWTLRASPANGLLHLQFLAFATESGQDFVKIYDQYGGLIASYSGTSLQQNMMLGFQAAVIFSTDSQIVNEGFSIAVSTIAPTAPVCGSMVNGSGLLQSINYPTSYDSRHSCAWTLQASPRDGFLYLDFQTFATEINCDILSIYNESGALAFTYSGSKLPTNLMLGSHATVIFTTDSSVVNSGFSIAVSTLGLAVVTFSNNPVYVGEPVTLTCSYGTGADLLIVTLEALNVTRKEGFLWCSVPLDNTIGDGVFYGSSFNGCPSRLFGWTNASVSMVATPALELSFSCSATVNDTRGVLLALLSLTASLKVLVMPSVPKFLQDPITFDYGGNATIVCDSGGGRPAAVLRIVAIAPSGRQASSDSTELLLPPPLMDWQNAMVTCSVTNHNFKNLTASSRVTINNYGNCELCWIIAPAAGGVILISVIIGVVWYRAKGQLSNPGESYDYPQTPDEQMERRIDTPCGNQSGIAEALKETPVYYNHPDSSQSSSEYDDGISMESTRICQSSVSEVPKEPGESNSPPDNCHSSGKEHSLKDSVYDDGTSLGAQLNSN